MARRRILMRRHRLSCLKFLVLVIATSLSFWVSLGPSLFIALSSRGHNSKMSAVDMVNDYYPFVDFKFVQPEIKPDMDHPAGYFLIVLVNSAAKGEKYRKRRESIRRTWGSTSGCQQRKFIAHARLNNLKWKLVFMLGKAGPETNDDQLNEEEARQNNDMLIGNITELYINNIIKLYMGLRWVSTVSNVKYTLKVDDDCYVRIPEIMAYLVENNFPSRFYGGATQYNYIVIRSPESKWGVSGKYYPEKWWPSFNSGAFFILSKDVLDILFRYIYIRKPFHTDDTYVAVALRDSGIQPTNIRSLRSKKNMPQMVREMSSCALLAQTGFGHNLDGKTTTLLYNRLESLCKRDMTMANTCSLFENVTRIIYSFMWYMIPDKLK